MSFRNTSSIALADSTTNIQIADDEEHFESSSPTTKLSTNFEETEELNDINQDSEAENKTMTDLRTPSVIERLLRQHLNSDESVWNYDTPSGISSGPQSPDSDYQSEEKRRGRPRSDLVKNLVIQGQASPSPIKCQYCARVFPREKSLQAHLRTHTGEKPYKCDYPDCGRAFTQSGQLKTHQRLHAGEKPFVCSELGCSVRFTHANRHCPAHPNAVLRRSQEVVLKTVVGDSDMDGDQVKEWMERYRRDRELSFKVSSSSKVRTKVRRTMTSASSAEQEQENYSLPKLRRRCLSSSDDDEGFEDSHHRLSSLNVTPSTPSITVLPLPLKFSNFHSNLDSFVTPMGNSRQSNCIIKTETSGSSCWPSGTTSPTSSSIRPQKLKRRWLEAALIQTEILESAQSQLEISKSVSDRFTHLESPSRPSVLVMAHCPTQQQIKCETFDTITLHKVEEDEGEVVSWSGKHSVPFQESIKIESNYVGMNFGQME